MTTLKLKRYAQLTRELSQYVNTLNALPLNDTAETYLNGISLDRINTDTVLAQHKTDTAAQLPNYSVYKAAGIDLSTQIPDCETTKAAIDSVVSMVKGFTSFASLQPYISYDSTAGAFAVNATGTAAIESAIITLTPEQETIYNAVHALFELLSATDLNKKILSDNVYNNFKKELNLDTLVYEIKQVVK